MEINCFCQVMHGLVELALALSGSVADTQARHGLVELPLAPSGSVAGTH